jgi:hypothetical protein
VNTDGEVLESVRKLKREFGGRLNRFLLSLWVRDGKTGERIIAETSR